MRTLHSLTFLAAALLFSSGAQAGPSGQSSTASVKASSTASASSSAVFSEAELDQMMAPIALYPDSLLAQILMASTYPGDFADAVKWSAAHPDEKGDAAVTKVANESWDPSVQSLVAFPQVLATFGKDPGWVQKVGDAFLAQPDAVMDSVQRLRDKAQVAGNLKSNEYQKVSETPAASTTAAQTSEGTTIVIEPADTKVVYVPTYDSTYVYGVWGWSSYPPYSYPPPADHYPVYAFAPGLAWGIGIGVANSLWGGMGWGNNDININTNRYNNINVGNKINAGDGKFKHNAANRDGVPYRDQRNRDANSRQRDGVSNRDSFRGDNGNRAQSRDQARNSLNERGMSPATSNREARNSASAATRESGGRDGSLGSERASSGNRQSNTGMGSTSRERAASNDRARQSARSDYGSNRSASNNAFDGARSPSQSPQQYSRGQSSPSSAHAPASSRPSPSGRSIPRSMPSRGGGGGGRRR